MMNQQVEPAISDRKRILVLYYSQSGDVRLVAEAFTAGLADCCTVLWHEIRPLADYPTPWRSARRFFDVMPESVLGIPPRIELQDLDQERRFDLVILAYQVWFLAPSLPVQSLFQSPMVDQLLDKPVVTLSVSRNMWQVASRRMKQLLADAGARHLDNVVVTHQGPPLATFVSTTRALLWGKRNRLLGIFPPAGISAEQLERVRSLGELTASRLDRLDSVPCRSLLAGSNPVQILPRYIVPEIVARRYFVLWARGIRLAGRISNWLRNLAVGLFAVSLPVMVVVFIPLGLLCHLVLSPFMQPWLRAHIAELKQPGGD